MGIEAVKDTSWLTGVVLLCVLAFVGMWDIYALLMYGHEATVSAVVADWSSRYPILTLLSGIVIGHIFWTQPPRNMRPPGG